MPRRRVLLLYNSVLPNDGSYFVMLVTIFVRYVPRTVQFWRFLSFYVDQSRSSQSPITWSSSRNSEFITELQVCAILSDKGLKTSMFCTFWSPFPYVDRMCLLGNHCCQFSPRFLGQFQKKILQNTENFLHSHYSIFMWFERKYFLSDQIQNTKNLPTGKLPLKNQKIIRKYFPAPFLPLFVKTGGHTSTNFPGSTQKLLLVVPFEYLA